MVPKGMESIMEVTIFLKSEPSMLIGGGETRVGALEVGVEPLGRLCEDGQIGAEYRVVVDRRAVILLAVEPQSREVLAVAGPWSWRPRVSHSD